MSAPVSHEEAWRRYMVARDLLDALYGSLLRWEWPHDGLRDRLRAFLEYDG